MDTKIIGGKIAQARKKASMSQAKLAQLLFISPQAVGKWERGESIPDIITFNRLAEILGVDLNYFSENFKSTADNAAPKAEADTIDDLEQPIQEEASVISLSDRQIPVNLTAVNLQGSDFAGISLYKGKFKASPLRSSNFEGSDLTGSLFEVNDARETNFDGANLTDCNFSITDLTDASFRKTTLVRTTFNMSGQGARFIDANMIDARFIKNDLRETTFENCVFDGVDFNYCDLRGICFDGQTFVGVKFYKSALNEASFKGATLRNISITVPFSLTNKSYMAMKTICFDGAKMDKLTYAALKGLHVIDLSKVIVI